MTTGRWRVHGPFGRSTLGLAVVAGLLLATPAWAQTTRVDEKQPLVDTVSNPCVPEDVPFEGFIRFKETTTVQPDGTTRIKVSNTFSGQGVGQVTQVTYSVGGELKIDAIVSGPGPFLFRQRLKVVSQGPTDNFFITSVFRINGDGVPTRVTFESDCRG